MTSSPDESTTDGGHPRTQSVWRPALRTIAIDALPPLAVFFILKACGVSDVIAYTAGGIVPLTRLIIDRVRRRPFNAISGVIAALLVVSVILAILTHDARAVIARGGVIYLVIAAVAAVSVPTRRPAVLLISRHVAVRSNPEAAHWFDEKLADPQALRAMRIVTAGWAIGFAVSAVLCVVVAYTLPVSAAAVASSLIEPLAVLLLAAATVPFLQRTMTSPATTSPATTAPATTAPTTTAPADQPSPG